MNLMANNIKMNSKIAARIAGVDMDIAVEGMVTVPDDPGKKG